MEKNRGKVTSTLMAAGMVTGMFVAGGSLATARQNTGTSTTQNQTTTQGQGTNQDSNRSTSQGTGQGTSTGTGRSTGSSATGQGAGSSTSQSGSMSAGQSMLSSGDRKFMMDAAMGGMTEVEAGRLAVEKGSSDAVKSIGQKIVDDHTKANDEL
ncbi:MAG: DUF4142 domain-containing protein, partial [Acidobacteriota bacterium]|nr:DUF4142 domain-containing protein [Acidobacteriota bacterium]